uniref:Dopamine beta-hydroxylase n=1 Tax=Rousettus aegyptiacus TaxID=9407 RepID=A0A7J8IH38_ROUAE|nr:dopamine beta-hydroxylase [Rousettus aegyptiacus]
MGRLISWEHLGAGFIASSNVPGPKGKGEWDLQPLPEIFSKLEEPAPRCPAGRGQSPAGPTVVSIGGGKG